MKKLSKVLSLFLVLVMCMGGALVSCSSDADEETPAATPTTTPTTEDPNKVNPKTEDEFKAQTATVSTEDLGGAADSAESSDKSIATVEVKDGALSITSVKAGTATITVKKTGYTDATINVTVAENGSIEAKVAQKFIDATAKLVSISVTESVELKEGDKEATLKEKLTVTAKYDNDSTSPVTDYTISGFDASKIGEEQNVTVTYSEQTATVKVTIKAKELSEITVTPATVEFEEGATEADLNAKLTVTAKYDNGATSDVSEFSVSGFDVSKTGDQTVKVTYEGKEATVSVKVMPLFKSLKFDSAFDGTTEKNYTEESADYVSADGTWTILHGVTVNKSKSVAKVSKNAAKSYNEDETYASRIQMKLEVLKLKVGKNKEVILRVDGGSASGDGKNRTLTAKGATTATWTSFKGSADGKVCAGFLPVKGDANGYVTLSADDNINIYGIKVVDSAEDLSTTVLGNSISYKDAKVLLSVTEVNKDESITASASVSEITTPLYANGLAGTAGEPQTLTTFNFYVDDGTEPVTTLPTSELGEHTVTAKLYTVAEDGTKTESTKAIATAKYTVVDPNAVKYTVTFLAGDEGTFADGATTTFEVEENGKLNAASIPKPTANDSTKRFAAWTSDVDGVTTESAITQNVTFTATYENRPSVSTYELDVSTATFDNIVKTSGNPTTGDITINGVKFEISGNKDKDLPDTQNSKKVINMGGKVAKEKNHIKFTTQDKATVTITFFSSSADRHAKIISETDSTGQTGTEATTKDKKEYTTTFTLSDAGTYYLGGDNGLYITKVIVEM